MGIKIGIRWDDESQNNRFLKAKKLGLLDFIEVNYPIAPNEKPQVADLPIYAHSAYNGLCSAYGINEQLASQIKSESDKYNSPWIGEHLSWVAPTKSGALGYVFNPIYNQDFFEISKNNIQTLKKIYQRPIALELGPQYQLIGDGCSEIDFHLKVAGETNCSLILDLAHLLISNNNLKRPLEFGLNQYSSANTIEVHIAGIRQSPQTGFWHDCHDVLPDDTSLKFLKEFCCNNKALQAVTFEHSASAPEADFFYGLELLNKILR
jgi:uncharacterized protein (UPF0276 family)